MPPRAFIVAEPTIQNIQFGGRYINVRLLAQFVGITKGYCSRILDGSRTAPQPMRLVLSQSLQMPLPEFDQAIRARKSAKQPTKVA